MLLALDIGEKRIGLAISDSGLLATPYGVLHRKSKVEDFAYLLQLITELQVQRLIVGLPHSLSGYGETIGPQAQRVMRYVEAMQTVISLPVEYIDESYSTVSAAQFLKATKGGRKTPIDAAAAAVILQNYLDAHRSEPNSDFGL